MYSLPNLNKGSKSISLFTSGSIGYVQVPSGARRVGILTSGSTTRVALNVVPDSGSTVVGGSALLSNLRNGLPVSGSGTFGINWFDLDVANDRALYFRSTTATVLITVYFV